MDERTVALLLDLNKQFYQTFGKEFSSTRQRLQPGVKAVLETLDGSESILDLGCGNGELARELVQRGYSGSYIGVDFSPPLLEDANKGWEPARVTFINVDLASSGWEKEIDTFQFDLATAFAVLHHLPGRGMRLDILRKVRSLLAEGGRFVHSEWQFLNSVKLRQRVQSWDTAGLAEKDVDPGDFLLDWRSGGRGLRYVHHFDESELASLAAESSFRISRTWLSDGANGKLGLYQVWETI